MSDKVMYIWGSMLLVGMIAVVTVVNLMPGKDVHDDMLFICREMPDKQIYRCCGTTPDKYTFCYESYDRNGKRMVNLE